MIYFTPKKSTPYCIFSDEVMKALLGEYCRKFEGPFIVKNIACFEKGTPGAPPKKHYTPTYKKTFCVWGILRLSEKRSFPFFYQPHNFLTKKNMIFKTIRLGKRYFVIPLLLKKKTFPKSDVIILLHHVRPFYCHLFGPPKIKLQ
jgi:hypothetical protein